MLKFIYIYIYKQNNLYVDIEEKTYKNRKICIIYHFLYIYERKKAKIYINILIYFYINQYIYRYRRKNI